MAYDLRLSTDAAITPHQLHLQLQLHSTQGAYKLARLGFRAKELLGGIDSWRRDGQPVAASHEPGSLLAAE